MMISTSEAAKTVQLRINFDGKIIKSFAVHFQWATVLSGGMTSRGYMPPDTQRGTLPPA
jgi:hypothetical protein